MTAKQVQTLKEAIDELNRLYGELRAALAKIPPAALLRRPADGGWTATEDLAHVAEMLGFWSGEIARIQQQPGITFGRIASNAERIRFIEVHAHDTSEQMNALLDQNHAAALAVLGRLGPDDLEKTGQHMKFGPQTIHHAIQEWLLDHLDAHVGQLQAILAEAGQ